MRVLAKRKFLLDSGSAFIAMMQTTDKWLADDATVAVHNGSWTR